MLMVLQQVFAAMWDITQANSVQQRLLVVENLL
jgi:hypothetical protein